MDVPKYQQIADDLRGKIDSGECGQGSQLPSEPDLGQRYGASRNTVRDAIKQLASLGLVTTRPGQGTFVARRLEPFVTMLTGDPGSGDGGDEGAFYLSRADRGQRVPTETAPKVEVLTAPEALAGRLAVAPQSQVVSRHQRRHIDGIPWSLQTSYYPFDFITRGAGRLLMAEGVAGGTVAYLADALNLRQTGYRDWITVRTPNGGEQSFFHISPDTRVFEIFRTAFDQNQRPMRVTVTVFPTDRNQFIVNVGEDLPTMQFRDEHHDPEQAMR
jgi:GntR family transcriptional regulator